ncbi:hypothetical protein EJB05_00116, partial [Eragrostis curvula]
MLTWESTSLVGILPSECFMAELSGLPSTLATAADTNAGGAPPSGADARNTTGAGPSSLYCNLTQEFGEHQVFTTPQANAVGVTTLLEQMDAVVTANGVPDPALTPMIKKAKAMTAAAAQQAEALILTGPPPAGTPAQQYSDHPSRDRQSHTPRKTLSQDSSEEPKEVERPGRREDRSQHRRPNALDWLGQPARHRNRDDRQRISPRRPVHDRHFGSTTGKHGKFGLLKEKIFKVAEKLKDNNKLQWLKLLHFHVGSMIPDTKTVHDAATEAAGIYCDLVKKYDAEMTTLDCGGGLGVDYDGTRSGGAMSVAYGLEQYASSIVQAVRIKCDSNGVPHPVLCTESGRAMVSHHSMIILEALSATPDPQDDINTTHEELLSVVEGLMSTIQKDPIIPSEARYV